MDMDAVATLGRQTLTMAAMLAGPLLLVAMVVGLLVTIFQTVTSIQEQTLTFVPKLAAVLTFMALLMPWFVRTLSGFTIRLYQSLPMAAQ